MSAWNQIRAEQARILEGMLSGPHPAEALLCERQDVPLPGPLRWAVGSAAVSRQRRDVLHDRIRNWLMGKPWHPVPRHPALVSRERLRIAREKREVEA